MGHAPVKAMLLAVVAAAALALVAPAVAAAPGDQRVVGSGRLVYDAGGTTIHSFVTVAATSGPAGVDPRGTIVLRDIHPLTGEVTTFRADVSTGCMIVAGNSAVVVGTLPEEEQFDVPPPAPQPFHITSIGVVVQETTEQGRPADLAQPVFLRAQSAANVCAGATLRMLQPYVGQFIVDDGITG